MAVDPPKEVNVLYDAVDILQGHRATDYGTPEDSLSDIAGLWSEYLQTEITPSDVAVMMILLKVARIGNDPRNRDHYVDIAGYAGLAAKVANV